MGTWRVASSDSLIPFVQEVAQPSSTIRADDWLGYNPLVSDGFDHVVCSSYDLRTLLINFDLTMQRLLIYAVLFIALFGGLMNTVGIPSYVAAGTEALIYLLLVVSLIMRIGKGISVPHLWYSFFYMLLISACSIAVNGSELRGPYSV